MTTLICNCNRTLPLDASALGRALGETLVEHSTLCRREAPAFQRALRASAYRLSRYTDASPSMSMLSAISAVGASYSQNEKNLAAYYERLDRGELPIARGIANKVLSSFVHPNIESNLRFLEAELAKDDRVVEAAVVGVPSDAWGETPVGFVVLKPGRSASDGLAGELQAFVKGAIAPYKYPREIEFVESLPKTATGKLRRVELRSA